MDAEPTYKYCQIRLKDPVLVAEVDAEVIFATIYDEDALERVWFFLSICGWERLPEEIGGYPYFRRLSSKEGRG